MVSGGANTRCNEVIPETPVKFSEVTTRIEFLVIEKVFDVVRIFLTELEQFQASIDLGDQFTDLEVGKRIVRVDLRPDLELPMEY